MHQMATKIEGVVCGVFTDVIIFEGDIKKPKCNSDVIGGIRETRINDFTKCTESTDIKSRVIDLIIILINTQNLLNLRILKKLN
jgi:hypothetical protein